MAETPEQTFLCDSWNGLNQADPPEALLRQSHQPTQNGWVPASAAGVQLPTARNMDWEPRGIRKRLGSAELEAIDLTLTETVKTTEIASATGAFDLNASVYAEELTRWVAVGDSNTTNPVIVYSDDNAASWFAATTIPAINGNAYAICWTGSLFVVGGANVGGNTLIFTSPDGKVWTDRSAALTGTPDILEILWTGTLIVAAGNNAGAAGWIGTSPTGVTWTDRTVAYSNVVGLCRDSSGGNLLAAAGVLWSLSAAVYDTISFSVTAQDTAMFDVAFKSDGSKMYAVGYAGDSVYQYTLSTPWDINTASYDSVSLSVAAQDSQPIGVFFKSDGSKMYILGLANKTVYQYTLSTPWVLTGGSYDTVSLSVNAEDTSPSAIAFKSDGSKMYMIGAANKTVYQYTLPTPWVLTSGSYDTVSLSVNSEDTSPQGIAFKSDGSKMYVAGWTNSTVYQYTLSTPWVLTGGSYDTVSLSVLAQNSVPSGIVFKSDGSKMYVRGLNGIVYQYSLTPTLLSTDGGLVWSKVCGPGMTTSVLFHDPTSDLYFAAGEADEDGTATGEIWRGNAAGVWSRYGSAGAANTALYAMWRSGGYLHAVGEAGTFMYSSDDGGNWTVAADIETINLNGAWVNDGVAVVVGDDDATDAQMFTVRVVGTPDSIVASEKFYRPADDSYVQIAVGKETIWIKVGSGSWAQITDSARALYYHATPVVKASLVPCDGHIFIGLDRTNSIQTYRTAVALDPAMVLGNTYTNSYGTSTNTITGAWPYGAYILAEFRNRLAFSVGNPLVEYTPEGDNGGSGVWDHTNGDGIIVPAGRVRALVGFTPDTQAGFNEALMIGTSEGWDYLTGPSAHDWKDRIPGAPPPLNHRCHVVTPNSLIYVGYDKSLGMIRNNAYLDLGRRLKNFGKTGVLDTMNVSASRNGAFAYWSNDRKQARFHVSTASTRTNDLCFVVDLHRGEPAPGMPQSLVDQVVRLMPWSVQEPDSVPWFVSVHKAEDGTFTGALADGRLYTLDSGNDDLGVWPVDSLIRLPEFTGTMDATARQKNWLHLKLRTIESGNHDITVAFYSNREADSARSGTVTQLRDPATYNPDTFVAGAMVRSRLPIMLESEMLQAEISNAGLTETFILSIAELKYTLGAEMV